MANLNQVTLCGRLTRDPEMRYTPAGLEIASFGLAINKKRKAADGSLKEETTFVDVTVFGKLAGLCQQYLAKGREALVAGELRTESWTDKATQQPRSKLGVVANEVQFLGGREGGAARQEHRPQPESRPEGWQSPSGYQGPPDAEVPF